MNKISKIIHEEINEIVKLKKGQQIGYHVTRRKSLESIKQIGLQPRVPEDFGEEGDIEGVYIFKTYDDMDNALWNWMGERIEDWEEENDEEYDEIALKIDMTQISLEDIWDTAGFEWTVRNTIPPQAIIEVINFR